MLHLASRIMVDEVENYPPGDSGQLVSHFTAPLT